METTPSVAEIKEHLFTWGETFRVFAQEKFKDIDVPSSITVSEPEIIITGERSSRGHHVRRQRSPFALQNFSWNFSDHVPDDRFTEATSAAELIDKRYGDKCSYKGFGVSSGFRVNKSGNMIQDYAVDPVYWVERHLIEAYAAEYARNLQDLAVGDRNLANEIADELIEFIEKEETVWLTTVILAGITTQSDLVKYENVSITKLTGAQSGAEARWPEHSTRTRENRPVAVFPENFAPIPSHVLTIEQKAKDKHAEIQTPPESTLLQRVIVGLELLGASPTTIHKRVASYRMPDWIFGGVYGVPHAYIPTNEFIRQPYIQIDEDLLKKAMELAKKIQDSAIGNPKSSHDTSIHRFMLGAARERNVDGLIDYIIALEAAIVGKGTEIGFRFRHFGAAFIGSNKQDREAIAKKLKQLYNLRSRLVHGDGKYPSQKEINDGAEKARKLCEQVLSKCLIEGWPTQEQFEEMLLS